MRHLHQFIGDSIVIRSQPSLQRRRVTFRLTRPLSLGMSILRLSLWRQGIGRAGGALPCRYHSAQTTAVGGARGTMRFVRITPDMSESVIQHLRESFFADEPLNKAVRLCERGEPHYALEQMCRATIADGLSLAAIEEDYILGVSLNGILKPGDIEEALQKIRQSTDEKFNKIFTILYTLSKDLDLFDKLDVDRILECRIISASDRARGRGLGKEMMKRSIEIAEQENFKIFKADATGAFSQKICRHFGMKVFGRVRYDEYLDSTGNPVFNVEPPHEELAVMILDLR